MMALPISECFLLLCLSEADMDKTIFCTPFVKFRFNWMPFRLVNALAILQHMMQEVLADPEEYCTVYIDDILIYSRMWEEHLKHLREVLERLRQHKLMAKPSKCVWAAEKLEYLGHIVGGGMVAAPQARVVAIKNFRKPVTKGNEHFPWYDWILPSLHQKLCRSSLEPHESYHQDCT